ncbi:hypothetical protein BSKO_07196 [Bryopsis sp. KO-2023]|nr:hypothetical protein BSKO_07196 [Bryopsis sp. KO-2023]
MAEWTLYYWPGFKGRGELVRLMFEEAGVAYRDVAKEEDAAETVTEFFFKGGQKAGFPARAPPAIQNGDFVLSETAVIMSYLGKKLGISPTSIEDAANVDQVLSTVGDAIAEGFRAFRPKSMTDSHESQLDVAKDTLEAFCTHRLPAYIGFIERVLGSNKAGGGFVVGDSVSAADFIVFHFMQALEAELPDAFKTADAPLAKAHMKQIAERPNIKAYQASDRCADWLGEAFM